MGIIGPNVTGVPDVIGVTGEPQSVVVVCGDRVNTNVVPAMLGRVNVGVTVPTVAVRAGVRLGQVYTMSRLSPVKRVNVVAMVNPAAAQVVVTTCVVPGVVAGKV